MIIDCNTVIKDKSNGKELEIYDTYIKEDSFKYYFLNSTFSKDRYVITLQLF